MLLETHICIAQLCHTFLAFVYRSYTNTTNLGAAVSKKSLYTSGMHYLNLGALGRWAVLLETPHSHRSIMPPVSSARISTCTEALTQSLDVPWELQ